MDINWSQKPVRCEDPMYQIVSGAGSGASLAGKGDPVDLLRIEVGVPNARVCGVEICVGSAEGASNKPHRGRRGNIVMRLRPSQLYGVKTVPWYWSISMFGTRKAQYGCKTPVDPGMLVEIWRPCGKRPVSVGFANA